MAELTKGLVLGDRVKDSVTGFAGKITSIATYLYEETQYLIQPETVGESGKYVEAVRLRISRLSLIEDERMQPEPDSGPMNDEEPMEED